jgi:hypothetical protein
MAGHFIINIRQFLIKINLGLRMYKFHFYVRSKIWIKLLRV